MAAFRPLENRTLRADVANEIIRAIAEGELKPGDRVIEQHLAEQMGISRAPIREALRELEGQGIVVTIDRKGAFVANLTRRDVEELFTLREALEGLAVRLTAGRATQADLDRLAACTAEMKAAAARADVKPFVESDLLFHELICERSGHRRLVRMLNGVRTLQRLFMVMSKYSMLAEDQLAREAEAHQPIIGALAARDAEAAESAIRRHIHEAMTHLSSRLPA
jgi:DNA-binding GntR family transcriptional regulator